MHFQVFQMLNFQLFSALQAQPWWACKETAVEINTKKSKHPVSTLDPDCLVNDSSHYTYFKIGGIENAYS